jgi:hypothetical protein
MTRIGVVAVTGGVAALAALNVGGLRERLFSRTTSAKIRSLAVLPLTNLSNDSAQEYFADGMTDALITDLSQISALRVISRTTIMGYKKTDRGLLPKTYLLARARSRRPFRRIRTASAFHTRAAGLLSATS